MEGAWIPNDVTVPHYVQALHCLYLVWFFITGKISSDEATMAEFSIICGYAQCLLIL